MTYKTYDEYKDSNIDWIGSIPKHWEVTFLKRFINSISSGKTRKCNDKNEKYPLYGSTGIIGTTNHFDYNGLFILIARVGAYAGKTLIAKGKIGITDNTLILDYSSKIHYKFLFYLLSIYDFKKLMIGSGQPLITGSDVKNILITKPKLNEQEQIANYLDKKTAKIDETISKNKKLIELLEEKRIALINKAVTKGLNPDTPMKDSGVEWVGEIPEHWECTRLKFLITKNAQYGANCEPEADENKFNYRYVRITDIDNDGSLKEDIVYLSSENAKGFVLDEGDILFARSGATVGKTYLYNKKDGKCCFAGYLIRYISNRQLLNPKYLLYFSFSKSYNEWIKIVSTQATIQNVSADKYDNLIISLPNIQEQNQIVEYLDKELTKIKTSISKIKENINLLEEYKTSLIHHAVTGKIDVRSEEI